MPYKIWHVHHFTAPLSSDWPQFKGSEPQVAGGYCTDSTARGLRSQSSTPIDATGSAGADGQACHPKTNKVHTHPSTPGGNALCPLHFQALDPKISTIKYIRLERSMRGLHVSFGRKGREQALEERRYSHTFTLSCMAVIPPHGAQLYYLYLSWHIGIF